MKTVPLNENHLRQLFDRLAPDKDTLGSDYMSMILEDYAWFYDDYTDCINHHNSTSYSVIIDDDESVIGLIEMSHHRDADTDEVYVKPGYWLYEPYRGRGIMTTELNKALKAINFPVVITIQPGNDASVRVAERLGFELKKTNDEYLYYQKT